MNSVTLTAVALTALLSENFILVNCLGIGTRTAAFQNHVEARRTGISVMMAMVVTVFFTWMTDAFLLTRYGLEHFRLLVFVLIAMGSVKLLRWCLRTFLPELSGRLDESLGALSTNCAALGAALLTVQRGYELDQALTFALFGGLGVLIILLSFAGLRESVGFDECPRAFRGIPIQLITGGLMALALVGFYGLHLT
jgi:electron transport complex protein RnfA